jgi:hypothetical protein
MPIILIFATAGNKNIFTPNLSLHGRACSCFLLELPNFRLMPMFSPRNKQKNITAMCIFYYKNEVQVYGV